MKLSMSPSLARTARGIFLKHTSRAGLHSTSSSQAPAAHPHPHPQTILGSAAWPLGRKERAQSPVADCPRSGAPRRGGGGGAPGERPLFSVPAFSCSYLPAAEAGPAPPPRSELGAPPTCGRQALAGREAAAEGAWAAVGTPSPGRPQGGAVALLRAAAAGGGGAGGKGAAAKRGRKGRGGFYKFLNFMAVLQQWDVHSICWDVGTENMHWAY